MKLAVIYIRKSVVRKGQNIVSAEVQEAECRNMAARWGDTEPIVLSDIGRSGRKKSRRPAYADMVERIRAGQVSAVYAYSLSRLNRSTRDWAELADLCAEHCVSVRLVKEGDQQLTTAMGKMVATILAAVAQMQADLASEQAAETIAARVANGERHGEVRHGEKRGEDPGAVVRAFEEGASFHAAARLLNKRGIRTRRGGPWWATSVKTVLQHHAPEIVPMNQAQRAKSAPPFHFARLLRCHCGRTLTGVLNSKCPVSHAVRRRAGSPARLGIEPHEAPVSEFPKQPSRKDGLGTMCTEHWRAYVKGLREARKAAMGGRARDDGG